jgi:hypothetical protein
VGGQEHGQVSAGPNAGAGPKMFAWAAGRAAFVVLTASLLVLSCSNPEPIHEFWGYTWGTPYTEIYADTADLKYRLGGPSFTFKADPLRIEFFDAQYGLGYGRVTLDFTPDGRLWHGAVRTEIVDTATVDSTLRALYARFGKETAKRTIRGTGGHFVWWQTALWLDRDFFAGELAPQFDPHEIRAIDMLHRGCLTDCPIYSVRFLSTGEAYLWGVQGTPHIGGFRGAIDTVEFVRLAAMAATPEFLAQQDYYGYLGLNLNRREARVDYGSFERIHASVERSAPPTLEVFLDRLDSAAALMSWSQIVSWDTIRLIDQPKVGLDSLSYLGAMLGRP